MPISSTARDEGPTNASQLWRDLRAQGFTGSYKVVARWLQDQGWQLHKGRFSQASKMQENPGEITPTRSVAVGEQAPVEQTPPAEKTTLREPLESPRHLVWLLLQEPTHLNEAEQEMLVFIQQEQAVDMAYLLAQQFIHLVHAHQAEELDAWLSSCASSHLPDAGDLRLGIAKGGFRSSGSGAACLQ